MIMKRFRATTNANALSRRFGVTLGSTTASAQFTSSSNNYLSVAGSSDFTLGTNSHTIEFWMYQTSRGDYDCPFSYNNGGSLFATNNYYLNVGTTQFTLNLGAGGSSWAFNLVCGTRPTLNVWHHYAIVRDEDVFTVYVDGTSVANVTSTASIAAQGSTALGIGSQYVNGSYFGTTGYITNFRFVNGTALYTSNFTPSTTPLTEVSGTQLLLQGLVDNRANGVTVTNVNTVTQSSETPFGTFIPTFYGTLMLWLDAADVTGTGTNPSNGTAITSWKDKSGLAKHATNVGSPVLSSTGVNGKPGIYLDGLSMGFRGALANTGTVSTTFIVATLNDGAGGYSRLVSMSASTGADFDNTASGIPFLRDFNNPTNIAGFRNNGALSTKAIPEYDTPFYASSTFNATNNTVYVNGEAATAAASSGTFAITKYSIGTQPNSNGDWWKGYVSEVLIYNSALSTTSREIVEAYLATKWSI
jgi:hypothetical protein